MSMFDYLMALGGILALIVTVVMMVWMAINDLKSYIDRQVSAAVASALTIEKRELRDKLTVIVSALQKAYKEGDDA